MPSHVVVLLARPEALSRAWSFKEEDAAYAFASGLRVAHEGSRVQVITAEDVPDRERSPKPAGRPARHPLSTSDSKIRIRGKAVQVIRPPPAGQRPACPGCGNKKALRIMPSLIHLSEMLAIMTGDDALYFCDKYCRKYFMTREIPK